MDEDQIKPCPHCGRQPTLYHGVCGDVFGDSLECDRDDCPEPDDFRQPWPYVRYADAVRRWNEYASTAKTTDE